VITVEKALKAVMHEVRRLGRERVDLLESLNRVLADPIVARRDQPPWDNSAMDGYAVCAEDVRNAPSVFQVVEEIPAGCLPTRSLHPGQASRIMTGAPLPQGADAVVRVEDTESRGKRVRILRAVAAGENIRKRAEDFKAGEVVIPKDTLVGAAEVGMMASVGSGRVSVYQRPRVAILATGDELVDLDEEPGPHQIRNSNAYALAAQVKAAGGVFTLLGIGRDRLKDLMDKLESARNADLILISGGVSVGKYDFVRKALEESGVRLSFYKVAMKPGHPLVLGTRAGQLIFGLPGNPVSTLVTFEEFVRPALLYMSGHHAIFRPTVHAVMKEPYRKEDGKTHFIRAIVTEKNGRYAVRTTGQQGSGLLSSMVKANALIVIPESVREVSRGQKVVVQLLDKGLRGQAVPGY
jgi:molybdopterin molybdotransferase